MLEELKILLLKSQVKGFFFPAKRNVLKEENFCYNKNIEPTSLYQHDPNKIGHGDPPGTITISMVVGRN